MDFGWGDALSLLGGPVGYLGYQGYKKQQQGNDAQNSAMEQARTGLGDLQKSQRLQRGEDLNRALSMFGPVDDYLNKMYGVAKPGAYIAPSMQVPRSGPAHFGAHAGSSAPPPPPVAPPAYAPPPGTPYGTPDAVRMFKLPTRAR